jgi:hypothetical protein
MDNGVDICSGLSIGSRISYPSILSPILPVMAVMMVNSQELRIGKVM